MEKEQSKEPSKNLYYGSFILAVTLAAMIDDKYMPDGILFLLFCFIVVFMLIPAKLTGNFDSAAINKGETNG